MSPRWQLWWLRANDGKRWRVEDWRGQQKHLNCLRLCPPLEGPQKSLTAEQRGEDSDKQRRTWPGKGSSPSLGLSCISVPQTQHNWGKHALCVCVCVCVCWKLWGRGFVCLEVVVWGRFGGLGLGFAVCSMQWALHLNFFCFTLSCFDCIPRCFPQGIFW